MQAKDAFLSRRQRVRLHNGRTIRVESFAVLDWYRLLIAFVNPECWKWVGIPGILKNSLRPVAVQTNIVNG